MTRLVALGLLVAGYYYYLNTTAHLAMQMEQSVMAPYEQVAQSGYSKGTNSMEWQSDMPEQSSEK